MVKGHYDKGRSIIRIVHSLSPLPLHYRNTKPELPKAVKTNGPVSHLCRVCIYKSCTAATPNYYGIIVCITKVTVWLLAYPARHSRGCGESGSAFCLRAAALCCSRTDTRGLHLPSARSLASLKRQQPSISSCMTQNILSCISIYCVFLMSGRAVSDLE